MRILLTNDDGIDAPGLLALYRAVIPLGEVFVVAPADVQSASSHAVTFHKPLVVRQKTVTDESGKAVFTGRAVAGRPADCVKVGRGLIESDASGGPIDLVVSGINSGANLGVHMVYSGTVAAAREGAMMGTPSIAVSLHIGDRGKIRWQRASEIAAQILAKVTADPLERGTLLNINIPVLDDGREPRGIRVVPGSTSPMVDVYRSHDHADAEAFHATDHMRFHETQEGSDVEAMFQRFVTITPLHFDLTDRARIPAWRRIMES